MLKLLKMWWTLLLSSGMKHQRITNLLRSGHKQPNTLLKKASMLLLSAMLSTLLLFSFSGIVQADTPTNKQATVVVLNDSRFGEDLTFLQKPIQGFLDTQAGTLKAYPMPFLDKTESVAEGVMDTSLLREVSPQLLLILMQVQSNLILDPNPTTQALLHPMDMGITGGFLNELDGAAKELSDLAANYAKGNTTLKFKDNTTKNVSVSLNPSSYAVEAFLAHYNTPADWAEKLGNSPNSFKALYTKWFADPASERIIAKINPNTVGNPSFPSLPWAYGGTGIITQTYHDAGNGGIDFYANSHQITPIADGVVIASKTNGGNCENVGANPGAGNYVLVAYTGSYNGWYGYYYHLAVGGVYITSGNVQAGTTVLGQQGHTGDTVPCNANGEHLHLQFTKDGSAYSGNAYNLQTCPTGQVQVNGNDLCGNIPIRVTLTNHNPGNGQCIVAKPDPGEITSDGSGGNCGGAFSMAGSANGQLSASCNPNNCRGGATNYTYNNTSNTPDNIGTWQPSLPQAGFYEVFIDVTNGYATTTGAVYKIHYKGGDATVTVNQNAHGVGSYEWISLGKFPFDAGSNGYVQLNDVVPEKGIRQTMISMDAASWKYEGSADPVGHFDSLTCDALTGWAWDPKTPDTSIPVHLYVDSTSPNGFVGAYSANVYRADVAQQVSHDNGLHGFSIQMPAKFKDGANHVFHIFAINSDSTRSNPELANSGLAITCTAPSTPTPTTAPKPTPTTTLNPPPPNYTYYLPFLANAANNYTTYLALQNVSNSAANINLKYYSPQGSFFTTDLTCPTLQAKAECLPQNPFAQGNKGVGIITSNQPLAIIVAEGTAFGGSAYAVGSGGSSQLIAPLAFHNAYGDFSTQLTVFNGSSTASSVTVKFYDNSGLLQPNATQTFNLAAISSQTLDQSLAGSNLPNGFTGWAQITGSGGSQLVAQVLEQSASQKFVAIATAQAQTYTKLYSPAIFKGAFSFNTGANIINPNAFPVSVSVSYYDATGDQLTTQPFTLAANSVQAIYHGGNGGGNGLPAGSGLSSGFSGAAIVNATGGGIAMVVNESGGVSATGTSLSGTYSAASNGSTSVGLPVMANGGFGYVTGTTIFNTSGNAVTGSIQYYDLSGNPVGQAQPFNIGPYASQLAYQGVPNVLASGFYGTALITQTGGGSSSGLIATTNALSNLFYTYTEPNS
jgi:hypothetical protein